MRGQSSTLVSYTVPKIARKPYKDDVVPHAIFWRPIKYFSESLIRGLDDLDYYYGVSYERGNKSNFDLRHYDGHPEDTTSLYLPVFIEDVKEIIQTVKEIINEIAVPKSAVAWQRDEQSDLDLRARTGRDKLKESEARIIALKIASTREGRTASTEYIKKHVAEYFPLTKLDLEPSTTRRKEQRWQQITGNVISHRDTPNGPFVKGYAIRTRNGLTVTPKGMNYLKSIGFTGSDDSPN